MRRARQQRPAAQAAPVAAGQVQAAAWEPLRAASRSWRASAPPRSPHQRCRPQASLRQHCRVLAVSAGLQVFLVVTTSMLSCLGVEEPWQRPTGKQGHGTMAAIRGLGTHLPRPQGPLPPHSPHLPWVSCARNSLQSPTHPLPSSYICIRQVLALLPPRPQRLTCSIWPPAGPLAEPDTAWKLAQRWRSGSTGCKPAVGLCTSGSARRWQSRTSRHQPCDQDRKPADEPCTHVLPSLMTKLRFPRHLLRTPPKCQVQENSWRKIAAHLVTPTPHAAPRPPRMGAASRAQSGASGP